MSEEALLESTLIKPTLDWTLEQPDAYETIGQYSGTGNNNNVSDLNIHNSQPDVIEDTSELNMFYSKSEEQAVFVIQRYMHKYTDKMKFKHIHQMLSSLHKTNPNSILSILASSKGGASSVPLFDKSCSIYLRFRLSGLQWPPMILYKIFNSISTVDINAFAPRHYHLNQVLKSKNIIVSNQQKFWYKRWENNGWYPIQDYAIMQIHDKLIQLTNQIQCIDNVKERSSHTQFYHYSKLHRTQASQKRKKQKKLAWMQKTHPKYRIDDDTDEKTHIANTLSNTQVNKTKCQQTSSNICDQINTDGEIIEKQSTLFSEPDDDETLLDWAQNLDFDDYIDNWSHLATTQPTNLVRTTMT